MLARLAHLYLNIKTMKQRIIYEIHGQIERNCFFRIGAAMVRVEFTGGAVNSAGIQPAQFVTDNPLYQHAIENSADFRNGIIRRGMVQDIEDTQEPVAEAEVENSADDDKIFPDVTNTQQARAVLMAAPYSCSLSELQNKMSVQSKADELGVLFPNWR